MKRTVATLLLLLTAAPAIAADDAPAKPASTAQQRAQMRVEIAAKLGKPALADPVHVFVDHALAYGLEVAVPTAQALRIAGGPNAVDGLLKLTRHADRTVRATVWESLAGLRLRRDDVVDLASRELLILSTPEESKGLAAVLGATGDSRQVSVLLEVAASEHEVQRAAAFAALRQLTNVRLPDRLNHWMSWWRIRKKRGDVDLHAALDAIQTQRTTNVSLQCRIVKRDAWFALPMVREKLREWLRVHDPRLRTVACGLVADLRLGDLIAAVDSVGRYADGEPERKAAAECLATLDVPISTWRKRLEAKAAAKHQ